MSTKGLVFWNVMLCNIRWMIPDCLQALHSSGILGTAHPTTESHPKRPQFSAMPLSKPQISQLLAMEIWRFNMANTATCQMHITLRQFHQSPTSQSISVMWIIALSISIWLCGCFINEWQCENYKLKCRRYSSKEDWSWCKCKEN